MNIYYMCFCVYGYACGCCITHLERTAILPMTPDDPIARQTDPKVSVGCSGVTGHGSKGTKVKRHICGSIRGVLIRAGLVRGCVSEADHGVLTMVC